MEGRTTQNPPGNYGNQGSSDGKQQSPGGHPPGPPMLRLSKEELQVLKECSRESFWYRCVPFAVGAVAGTQFLVRRGIWKAHPRFGSMFKNMGATLVAYILGKVSYQPVCREKLMNVPNSTLAEALKSGRKGHEVIMEMARQAQQMRADNTTVDDPAGATTSGFVMDRSSTYNEGLDDSNRPTVDSNPTYQSPASQPMPSIYTNYDDLRRQNRAQYTQPSSASQPNVNQTDTTTVPQPQASNELRPKKSFKTNQYGDIIEE